MKIGRRPRGRSVRAFWKDFNEAQHGGLGRTVIQSMVAGGRKVLSWASCTFQPLGAIAPGLRLLRVEGVSGAKLDWAYGS